MKTTIQTLLLFVFLSAAAAEENQNYYLNTPIEDLVANTSNPANNSYLNKISYEASKTRPTLFTSNVGDVLGGTNASSSTLNKVTTQDIESLRADQNENEQDYTYETKNKYQWAWLLGGVGFLFVIIGIAMRYKK